MLALLVMFTVLFLVFAIYSKTSGFFKECHHTQEMQAIQERVDNAKTSRFTELRELLSSEFKKQADLYLETTATVLAKLEQLDSELRTSMKT